MIEESFLPMRFLMSEAQQFFTQNGSQRLNPPREVYPGWGKNDKQMDMVRH